MKIPILLPNIFNHPFTYKSSNLNLELGDYVEVTFGKNKKIEVKDFCIEFLEEIFKDQGVELFDGKKLTPAQINKKLSSDEDLEF